MLSNIIKRLGRNFSTEVQKTPTGKSSSAPSAGLTSYIDGQLVTRTAIVLKKQEDIESYVIKTVQSYFRTTYKAGNNR